MKTKKIALIIQKAPQMPGIYLFKQADGSVVYIGKARVLKNRLKSYLAGYGVEWKATSILDAADTVEWQETATELEALLLEAQMIQSYQPPFNILLKTGQPYAYFLISTEELPQFVLARTKTKKGTYFGPFIDKGAARGAFRFLQETFQLLLCSRQIENGCLAYHIGRCAGSCKPDFDRQGYLERLALLKKALQAKPEEMLADLEEQIHLSNKQLSFERSARLTFYKQALAQTYTSIAMRFDRPTSLKKLAEKDIWVWQGPRGKAPFGSLFLFRERRGVVTKERVLYVPLVEDDYRQELSNYLLSYYRLYRPSPQILVSDPIVDPALIALFLVQWHQLPFTVVINAPARQEHAELMVHAQTYAAQEALQPERAAALLRSTFKLSRLPVRIDCFDISHKQGHAMVGACVRFTNGVPDHGGLRYFHIKTVDGSNDYASLQEIVQRRYASADDMPDLVVIDGGKGQLSAVTAVMGAFLKEAGVDLVSLAKREETLYSEQFPEGKILKQDVIASRFICAVRDYAHWSAISFHRKTELKKMF